MTIHHRRSLHVPTLVAAGLAPGLRVHGPFALGAWPTGAPLIGFAFAGQAGARAGEAAAASLAS